MVPPVAVQVTAGLLVPVTVAVNCWVPPGGRVALVGSRLRPTWVAIVTVAVIQANTSQRTLKDESKAVREVR